MSDEEPIVLPEWLPNAVRRVAIGFDFRLYPVGERLLTDMRMERVWKTLNNEGLQSAKDLSGFEKRLNDLPERYRRETWDPSTPGREPNAKWFKMLAEGAPLGQLDRADTLHPRDAACLADNACASFFLASTIIFTLDNHTVREHDIKQEVNRWQDGARLCREALESPHRATVDPGLAEALSKAAAYFQEYAALIETTSAKSPYLIKRKGQNRAPGGGRDTLGNENIRGQVREFAGVTEEIFANVLYGTVATAVSVATGLPITAKSVEHWCAALVSQ